MIIQLALPGLLLATPKRHGDQRGVFFEGYRKDAWAAAGVIDDFIQDNVSFSNEAGVIRGLHFQSPPHAQAKLVRCSRGEVLDVVVDLRVGSPAYGKHLSLRLSEDTGEVLYVPAGYAHGFCTLRPGCEVVYKCSDYYAPECDRGLAFDDPDLAIDWPVARASAILSDKDARQPAFKGFVSPFRFGGDA